jgi:hypothetical protein
LHQECQWSFYEHNLHVYDIIRRVLEDTIKSPIN